MLAGSGPDGTDVAGLFLPFEASRHMLTAVYRSVLPLALQSGLTTEERSERFFEDMQNPKWESTFFRWPLLMSGGSKSRSEGVTGLRVSA